MFALDGIEMSATSNAQPATQAQLPDSTVVPVRRIRRKNRLRPSPRNVPQNEWALYIGPRLASRLKDTVMPANHLGGYTDVGFIQRIFSALGIDGGESGHQFDTDCVWSTLDNIVHYPNEEFDVRSLLGAFLNLASTNSTYWKIR